MKIHYLLNEAETHYVFVEINQLSKTASIGYVKDDLELIRNQVSIAEVLDTEPTINPQVHIAKKGRIWDFHLWKIDSHGEEVRNSVGMLLPDDLTATDIKFINDDPTDITMKNYATQPLEVYNSVLTVNNFDFSTKEKLVGHSGNGRSEIVIQDGLLELAHQAQVFIPLISGDGMSLEAFPFSLFFDIEDLGSISETNAANFTFQIGSNFFMMDTLDGVVYDNGDDYTVLFDASVLKEGKNSIILHVRDETILDINGVRVTIPNFIRDEVINAMEVRSFTNPTEPLYLNHVITHAAEPYKLDSKAPGIVLGLTAEPGYEEILLRWDPNSEDDLAGYNVYVDGLKHNKSLITDSTYRVMNLVNDVTYHISVTAVDTANNESPTFHYVQATPSDEYDKVEPQPPQNVQGTASNGAADITWDANTEQDLKGYNIYFNDVKQNTELLTVESYHAEGLTNGQDYEIYVTAVDLRDNESGASDILLLTPLDENAPSDVTNLSETHTATTVSLSWNHPIDADFSHCNIYRDGVFIHQTTDEFFDDTGLSSGTYEYIVTAVDTSDNESNGRSITVTIP